MAKFEIPQGWVVQAFRFTLDPTEDQAGRWRGISAPVGRRSTGPWRH